MNLVQYTKNRRTRLASGGVGTDPRDLINELFRFFHEEMDDLDAEWKMVRDPLSGELYPSDSCFQVFNRHSRIPVLHIQLEF